MDASANFFFVWLSIFAFDPADEPKVASLRAEIAPIVEKYNHKPISSSHLECDPLFEAWERAWDSEVFPILKKFKEDNPDLGWTWDTGGFC